MQVLQGIVSRPLVLACALAGVLMMTGCAGSDSSSSGTNSTATPTFNPGAGSYNVSQTVTIADSTPGAVLYCTTDGTTPTASSPHCSQPTTVFKSEFLLAIAIAPGKTPSAVASVGYTINLNAAATPTFSPAGGSYTSAQTVVINDATAGANLYYTTDGSVPSASSTLYTGPITIAKSTTLSAIAIASGFANSGVASASYVVGTGTAAPVISPAGGTFATTQSVAITDATSGASIFYTTDGSVPTAASTPYLGTPIVISTSETISAVAIASGNASSVTVATFTINIPAAAPPTFNPSAGTYSSAQTVILGDATPGATIYYTADGSAPTTASPQYGNPITVSTSETIKAIATASGFGSSAVSSAAYTINQAVAPPTFNPAAGSFNAAQTVSISDTTAGATIHYTTDGSTPTTSSTQYSAPITVSSTTTLNAIAVLGGATSPPVSAAYIINLGPTFSGTVMSGTLPVHGAQVQMYVAGAADYGSAATPLLTAAVTSDGSGAFSFTYNCPAATSGDLVYLVATGGSTGSGGSNSGLAFMAALGSCNGTLPNTVVLNEVTTVASVYALSPFMTASPNVGSTASNYSKALGGQGNGLANAFGTVANLVNLTTGQALDHTPAYPGNLANDLNILNNSTVPQSRINALANTLNLCAVDGGGCSSLFSAATVGSGSAPADTLQTILNIAQNPGNNAGTLYNVTAGSGPFTPTLGAAPNDWTLALTFTGGGLGFAPGLPVTFAGNPGSTGQFLNSAMTIDAAGNIWVAGFNNALNAGISPDLASGMIAEFSNLGVPITPASSISSGIATYGGNIPIKGGTGGSNAGTIVSHGIGIDPSGNAWFIGGNQAAGSGASSGGALTEIGADLHVVLPDISIGQITPSPIAIDGVGSVWAQGDTLQKFDSGGNLKLSNAGAIPTQGVPGYFAFQSFTFDSNATSLWGFSSDGFGDFYQINPADASAIVDYYWTAPGVFSPLVAGAAAPDGSAGNVYACGDAPGQTLDAYNVSSSSPSPLHTYSIPTGRGCGNQIVLDGVGHFFTVFGGATPGIVDEFTITGTAITPVSPVTTGYTGTSTGESPIINPDPNAPVVVSGANTAISTNAVMGAAIDGSGNLWVLNENTGPASSKGNALVEFIGIAAPVVTPTSLALQFGQVGVRP
ncbi:MAG: hypothetical protein JWM43_949 [Acidobacteriaceae bacterium]|nr:hypothetical protein [Acidobacteriaceae bacterium]